MDRPDRESDERPHFDGRHFANLDGPRRQGFWQFLRWRLTGDKGDWPEHVDNAHQDAPLPEVAAGQVAATLVNHATFLLRAAGLSILTDPIWSQRASPVTWAGPRRVRPPGISFDRLPKVDVVLVSHNHYDHMDLPTLRRLAERDGPVFVTTLGNRRYLERHGLKSVTELDWWQTCQPGASLSVTLTPARHFSARGVRDRDRTLWGGFWITPAGAPTVYFAADTGMGVHFRMIRERLGSPDLALVPIGAYEPRWFMSEVHMDPAQAVDAHFALGARKSLAMHYGTFQMADEAFDAPLRELAEAKRVKGVTNEAFGVPEPGETVVIERAIAD